MGNTDVAPPRAGRSRRHPAFRLRARVRTTAELILVPSLLTLSITLLRLTGELLGWSSYWFNPTAGGGAAPVGITWLIPIFGAYFGLELARNRAGQPPVRNALAALVATTAAFGAGIWLSGVVFGGNYVARTLVNSAIAILAILAARRVWPTLHATLFVYALSARIPIALIMAGAIVGQWGTYYDALPSLDLVALSAAAQWVATGLLPQMTFWVGATVVVGMLSGVAAHGMVAARTNERAARLGAAGDVTCQT